MVLQEIRCIHLLSMARIVTRSQTGRTCLLIALVSCALALFVCAQTSAPVTSSSSGSKGPATMSEQLSTRERLQKPGWWPTKGTSQREGYVGAAACAQCHSAIAATQKQSAMARAASPAIDSEILRTHPLHYQLGPYTYVISRSEKSQTYSVTDGDRSVSGPLSWAFGIRMGQSWFFDYGSRTFLVPLTYYPDPKEFTFTVDQPHSAPDSLQKAVGRPLTASEVRGCFECHTTGALVDGRVDAQHAVPGVTCEACHGPGVNHVAAAKAGLFAEQGITMIMNPRYLNPVDSVDYCGSCHRTWWDVTLDESPGPKSLRFQPYRLENSRCWGKGDARITCIACHDPHRPLVTDAASYDERCLACHVRDGNATADHPGSACPTSKKDCVSCHMPQYKVVDIPVKFTDHQIRVVRAGVAIPE